MPFHAANGAREVRKDRMSQNFSTKLLSIDHLSGIIKATLREALQRLLPGAAAMSE